MKRDYLIKVDNKRYDENFNYLNVVEVVVNYEHILLKDVHTKMQITKNQKEFD